MNENNEMFIRYFEYYKMHPEKFKSIDSSMLTKAILMLGLFFILLLFYILQISRFSENIYTLSLLLFFGTLFVFVVSIYIEILNKRYFIFCNMLYSGNPADLFGNLGTPEIAEHLESIKRDLKKNAGISGHTAYYVSLSINDPNRQAERKKRKEAHKLIDEIEKIQNKS